MNKNSAKADGGARKPRSPQQTKKTTRSKTSRRSTAGAEPVIAISQETATVVVDALVVPSTPLKSATGGGIENPKPTVEASPDEAGPGRGRGRGRRGGRGRGRGRRDAQGAAVTESGAETEIEPIEVEATEIATVASGSIPTDGQNDLNTGDTPFGFGLAAQNLVHRAPVVPAGRTVQRAVSPPPQRPLQRSREASPPPSGARPSPRETLPAARPTPPSSPNTVAPPKAEVGAPPRQESSPDRRAPRGEDDDRGGRSRRDRERYPRRGASVPVETPTTVDTTDDDEPVGERLERFVDDERSEGLFDELSVERDDDLFPEVAEPTDAATGTETEKGSERRGGGRRRRGGRARGRGPAADEPAIDELDDEAPIRVEPEGADEEPESFDEEVEDEPLPQDYKWAEAKLDRPKPREMVINVSGHDECRIAILQDGRLEELFIERTSSQSHVGNIYKGKVTNVEPSIQAAFIDFGLPKNGFLHISDVQPQYFPNHSGAAEDVGRKIPRHHRPPIQKCFRRGQEVIVQITKEGVGTKGPTLTTYLSMPGRFLVMMPGMNRHGVSRKIEDEQSRRQMRDVLNQLTFPPGMGFILRTAGMDRNKRELQRDLHYLMRLWKRVVDRVKRNSSPAELYRESDLITRTIRDCYTADFDRVIVDDTEAARKVSEFLRVAMPRSRPPVELYSSKEPMFHRLGVEDEIERINARHVPLQSGGSLVIDSTEALVAIDVNSGRFRSLDDAEETALRINIEASEEIARQLRLRDLGGLIVCDFIDMRLERNRRKVERALRDALKNHKERARCLRMSAFGLIEMTRQRQGPSMKRNIYSDCVHCRGSGLVKMPESVVLDVMRDIQLGAYDERVRKVTVTVSNDMAYQILNSRRTAVSRIEAETGATILIRGDANFTTDQIECAYEDGRGQPVPIGE